MDRFLRLNDKSWPIKSFAICIIGTEKRKVTVKVTKEEV